jgi:hypothetical protein
MSTGKISHEDAKEALLRSGHLLESRLEKVLLKGPWLVRTNDAYPDPITGKTREIDLSAITAENIDTEDLDWFFVTLTIECVNNPQPIAFLTKKPVINDLFQYEVVFSGNPLRVIDKSGKDQSTIQELVQLKSFHHYCKGSIATQFCSFSRKKHRNKDEWYAHHDSEQFDGFSHLCDSQAYEISKNNQILDLKGNQRIGLAIHYPILVVQNSVLEISESRGAVRLSESDHVHFVRNLVEKGEERSVHIDVVTEKFFQNLLDIIIKESEMIVKKLKKDIEIIHDSMKSPASAETDTIYH